MTDWGKVTQDLERLLRLTTYPVAYKRLEKAADLEKIPRVRLLDRTATFCQVPTLVRRGGWTVGITRNNLSERCARINGLALTTDEEISREAAKFATSWFADEEEARKQMAVYPVIPAGEALVLAPLSSGKFEPDVVLIYGNPAQLMLLMNALQFKDYERFNFFFIGEGSCADGLAQCYTTDKPSLAVPCFGERRFGGVTDDELVLAVPPRMMEKAVEGLQALWDRGLRYPIMYFGPECDPSEALAR
ncbi:MAG: DUF169 domain-containing protein [Dehalococcoidales bacterium]|nr:DUF169 domain-containing protein [Dehalococcoidales bacterium]MDP7525124.1 DUF169 domain-containing protein [Dehalococcoidales bacterium]